MASLMEISNDQAQDVAAAMAVNAETICTFRDNEGNVYNVPQQVAFQSNLLKTLFQPDVVSDGIPVVNINAQTMTLVLEYMDNHKNGLNVTTLKQPLEGNTLKSSGASDVDDAFMQKVLGISGALQELILGAHYLDIQPLLNLGCAQVALTIKGVPKEEIPNRVYGLLSPEQRLKAQSRVIEEDEEKKE
jgi:hypothetical protein